MALCILPLHHECRRRPYFSFVSYRNRATSLMAFARFLLISSPECPPKSPFSVAFIKKYPSGAFSISYLNVALVVLPPAHDTNICPSSSLSRFISMLPVMNPDFSPAAPVSPVSSSRVKRHSIGPCSMSSESSIASSMAQPMPSSAPSVVPRAFIQSPSI